MNNLIPTILQMIRFGIVGVIAAAVHFSIVVMIVETWSIPPLVANIAAFLLSFHVSYFGHRLWTFSDTTALHREALPKLFLVQSLTLAANESLFYVFLTLGLPYPVALIIVLTILPLFTYVSSRFWVFR